MKPILYSDGKTKFYESLRQLFFFNLAALGLSRSTWDLHCVTGDLSPWRAGSEVACRLSCSAAGGICFPTRDRTCVPCIGRWIFNHWIVTEVPRQFLKHQEEFFLLGTTGERLKQCGTSTGPSQCGKIQHPETALYRHFCSYPKQDNRTRDWSMVLRVSASQAEKKNL